MNFFFVLSSLVTLVSHGKVFQRYSIYAWGTPCVLLAICAVLDFVPFVPHGVKPHINICYLENWWPFYVIFYGPKAFLLLMNVLLFVKTSSSIWKTQTYVRKSIGHNQVDADWRFSLYIKMFIISGGGFGNFIRVVF